MEPQLIASQGMTNYPCVPGHELAGVVVAVGKNVTKVQVRLMLMVYPSPRRGTAWESAVSWTAA